MIELNREIFSNFVIKKVFSASTMFSGEGARGKNEGRQRWSIIIKSEGETQYYSNGREYLSDINNIVVLPKGCSYEWICRKEGRFTAVEFESESTNDEIFSFKTSDGDRILKIMRDIEFNRMVKKEMYEVESIRDCYSVILKLAKSGNEGYFPPSKQQKIAPAIEYIAKNFNKDIKNDNLAELCGMSTVYFRKLFREIYDVSPITYVHKLRVKKAKELLRGDWGNMTDIALSLGYSDVYGFSRDFKKHTGVPPSKY